jgi:hypothetical protein
MGWHKGPLPPNTWGWGGVVPHEGDTGTGFFFADFKGDSVEVVGYGKTLKAHEVKYWNNDLGLPPESVSRAMAAPRGAVPTDAESLRKMILSEVDEALSHPFLIRGDRRALIEAQQKFWKDADPALLTRLAGYL